MIKHSFEKELSLARKKLNSIDISWLQNSELKKNCKELELSFVYPGPIPYQNSINLNDVFLDENLSMIRGRNMKLYVHLPFCRERCKYCFYESEISIPIEEVDNYLNALVHEFDLVLDKLRETPNTDLIYFGGGTPNYLTPEQSYFLLSELEKRVCKNNERILCIENSPFLVTDEHIEVYSKFGVNRISLGIQSFQDTVLRNCGRQNSIDEIIKGYKAVSICPSIKEINIDIIAGLPGETLEDWFLTLEKLLRLNPKPHEITTYHFKFHPYSMFAKVSGLQQSDLPSLEEILLAKLMAKHILEEEGYVQNRPHHFLLKGESLVGYERAPGMEIGGEGLGFQIGIGCSSYSHIGEFSYHNLQHREEYVRTISKGNFPFLRGKRLTEYEKEMLYVLGNLCSKGSMNKSGFNKNVQNNRRIFEEKLQELKVLGLIQESTDNFELTMSGKLWYEEVGRFFYPDDMKKIFDMTTK